MPRWTGFPQPRLWWPTAVLAIAALVGLFTLAIQPTGGSSNPLIFAPNDRPAPLALDPDASRTIDLNYASQAELETLPAIGPGRALDIIEARRDAPIRSLDDAVQRGLMSRTTAAQLTELVSVDLAAADR